MKERIYIKIAAMRKNERNIEDAKHIVLAPDTIEIGRASCRERV